LLSLAPAAALAQPGPVVVELFTSESCSSCPPADALLAELAQTRPDVLPLAFHVDYWNQLSWRDRFSFAAATDRQRDYAAKLGAGVYTPQIVVGGRLQAVGSDRGAVLAAITQAQADQASAPALTISQAGGQVQIQAGAGAGSGQVLLLGFDRLHTTHVGSGENGGVTLAEANAVRSVAGLGRWHGKREEYAVQRPSGERMAALLQAQDGRILASALLN
jgi:hypothetical protein